MIDIHGAFRRNLIIIDIPWLLLHDPHRTAIAAQLQELISAETDAVQKNRMILGRAVLLGALNRRESRGAHTRTDHPERDDKSFRKTTIVVYDGKEIKVSLRDIPEKRGEEQ